MTFVCCQELGLLEKLVQDLSVSDIMLSSVWRIDDVGMLVMILAGNEGINVSSCVAGLRHPHALHHRDGLDAAFLYQKLAQCVRLLSMS